MKKIFSLGIISLLLFFSSMVALAAPTLKVYIDGQELVYDYGALPQLVGDSAMLPVRQTAEAMGMTFTWDGTTGTMTFTKDGRNVVHTLYQSVIYVNSQMFMFTASSMSINDRTMMPADMLAQAIGCEINVDVSSYSVHIFSGDYTLKPNIYTATAERTGSYDDYIDITIVGNKTTNGVRLMDSGQRVVGQSTTYTASGDNRTFVIRYKPEEGSASDTYSLLAVPGDGINYYMENGRSVIFSVVDKLEVTSIEATRTAVYYGESTTIRVYTSGNATKVRLTNNRNEDILERTNYNDAGGRRYFEFTVTPRQRVDMVYTAAAGTANGYNTNNTRSITIYYGSSSGSSTYYSANDYYYRGYYYNGRYYDYYYDRDGGGTGTIHSVRPEDYDVRVGYDTRVEIETDSRIDHIEVIDDNNKVVASSYRYDSSSGSSSNYRTWYVYVPVSQSGTNRYRVYAYDYNDRYTSYSFSLYGTNRWDNYDGSGRGEYPYIYYARMTDYDVGYGDYVYLTLETNDAVEYVWIEDPDGRYLTSRSNRDYDNRYYRTWEIGFSITKSGRYTVYAENGDGDRTYQTFTIRMN